MTITLRALVRARWVLLGLLAAYGGFITLFPQTRGQLLVWFPEPPGRTGLFVTLGVWLLANLVTKHAFLRRGTASRRIAGAHLIIDATILTVLLGLSGGPTNPFTTIYFVPITLATQVSPRWTWALAAYCLAGFGSLFLLHPLPHEHAGHEAHFSEHLRGMWVAFGVSGALVTYFVHSIALALAERDRELVRLREQALQDRHLTAMGTLVAGAAHELGTPLGTINLLAGDLPHMERQEQREALEAMRSEIARCKSIVHRMATPELSVQSFGSDGGAPWSVLALREAAAEVASDAGVELVLELGNDVELRLPKEPLVQIVRELVLNAVEACRRREGQRGTIRLVLGLRGDDVVVEVHDDGVGMTPEVAARAFEPFYSTRSAGMGLGLYLARAQLRQLGGHFTLDSQPGLGTSVRLTFPKDPITFRSGFTPPRP